MALRALKSIKQRINSGVGILNRDIKIFQWSFRLMLAQLDRNDKKIATADVFAAHLPG